MAIDTDPELMTYVRQAIGIIKPVRYPGCAFNDPHLTELAVGRCTRKGIANDNRRRTPIA